MSMDDQQPDDVLEQAQAAFRAAHVALAQANRALQLAERRSGVDRRGRPRGGRRVSDPIDNLATHTRPLVSVRQLADYWGKHPVTVGSYVRDGRLKAVMVGGEYRIAITDAREFEQTLDEWKKKSVV
jgi:hypothetical protein